jgi:hypothetical protein
MRVVQSIDTLFAILLQVVITSAFTSSLTPMVYQRLSSPCSRPLFLGRASSALFMADNNDGQVVELADDDEITTAVEELQSAPEAKVVAPFLSQGEISEEAMEMDWSDPKQQRVMFYIILSLIPVLFLIPLMLGSRDLIPIDALPPVEL